MAVFVQIRQRNKGCYLLFKMLVSQARQAQHEMYLHKIYIQKFYFGESCSQNAVFSFCTNMACFQFTTKNGAHVE